MYLCVYVCVSTLLRALLTIHMKSTYNNWLHKFYNFQFLYVRFAINKMDGCDLGNIVHYEICQEDKCVTVLATTF